MDLVAGMDPRLGLAGVGEYARRVESLGYSALHVPEMINDPFTVAALAIESTSTLRVRTGVALAFVRSPMATALAAWALAHQSGGRFDLGLGPQIRPNIEQRYGAEFDRPVARIADCVAAVRACFAAFAGSELHHEGDFYRLTRLQPEFRPTPLPGGVATPTVWLGAVGDQMARLAGRCADGVMTHPTNSHRLDLAERLVPALQAGADRAGRPRPPIIVSPLIATGATPRDVEEALVAARRRLAFLYSTPAYRPTLERLGFGDVGAALRDLIREERWTDLDAALPADLVAAVVPAATWDDLSAVLHNIYADLATAVVVRPPADPTNDRAFRERLMTPHLLESGEDYVP